MSANLINYTERKPNNPTSANTNTQHQDRMYYTKADASAIIQSSNIILSECKASDRIRVTINVLHGIQGSRYIFEVCHSIIDNQLRKLEDTTAKDATEQEKGNASQRVRRRIREILNLQKELGIELIKYKPGSKLTRTSSSFELPIIDLAIQAYQLAKRDPEYKKHPGQTLEKVSRELARKLLEEAKEKRQIKEKSPKSNPLNQQLAALDKLERLLPNTDKNLSLALEAALKASLDINQITHHIEIFRDSIFEISNMVIEELHSQKTQNEGRISSTQGGDIYASSEVVEVENEVIEEAENEPIPFTSEGYPVDLVIENAIVIETQNNEVVKCSACDGELSSCQELERKLCSGCFSKSVSSELDSILVGRDVEGLIPVGRERIYQALHMLASFVSVGAVAFFLLLKDKDNVTKVACRKSVVADLLMNNIDRLLAACDKWQVSLIVRPILPLDSKLQFLQLDDLNKQVALSENLVLLSLLTLKTSKDNYQSWIAVKDISQEDKKLIRGQLIEELKADSGATGAVRLAGSYNFKPEYESDIPVIKLVDYETSLTVSIEQLKENGFVQAQASPPCDSNVVVRPSSLRWYSYEKALSGVPLKKDGVTPDYSVADMNFVIVNLSQGFTYDLVRRELGKIRQEKVSKNPVYLDLTMREATEYLRKKNHPLFSVR